MLTYVLDEVTDDGVVEVLDVGPLNALRQKTGRDQTFGRIVCIFYITTYIKYMCICL